MASCPASRTAPEMPARPLPVLEGPCQVGVGFSMTFEHSEVAWFFAARRIREMGFQCVRIWTFEHSFLKALLDAGFRDVLVDVPLSDAPELAKDWPSEATDRIVAALRPFHEQGMTFRIGFGKAPLTDWEASDRSIRFLPKAVDHLSRALQEAKLRHCTVTVAFWRGVLAEASPPGRGVFSDQYAEVIHQVAELLYRNGGEFVIDLFPWFTWVDHQADVPLSVALGMQGSSVGDGHYVSLLHQEVAAVRTALIRLSERFVELPLTIGATGWPSFGAEGATVENAGDYARSTIRAARHEPSLLGAHIGTVFLHEAFDDNTERSILPSVAHHFGIFKADGEPKLRVEV